MLPPEKLALSVFTLTAVVVALLVVTKHLPGVVQSPTNPVHDSVTAVVAPVTRVPVAGATIVNVPIAGAAITVIASVAVSVTPVASVTSNVSVGVAGSDE